MSVDTGQSLIEAVIAQMSRWVASKQLDVPADTPGRYVLGDNDVITVLMDRDQHGWTYRWRRHHPFAQGAREMHRTTVTAVEHPDTPGWLWTEIELPNDSDLDPTGPTRFMSVPAFLRSLIGELSCHDGRTPITAEPQWLALSHLPDLMDYLADDLRRGPVYVASQEHRDTREFEIWVRDVTKELVGLGTVFLVGGVVEDAFNEMVGPMHAVHPGTIRTYLPSLNLDDPEDPRRHRTLGKDRIGYSSARQLGHVLGLSQRDQAARAALPAEALVVNQLMADKERAVRDQARPAGRRAYRRSTAPSFATSQHNDATILRALQSLEEEIRALRDRLNGASANGQRRLNPL
ncbi:hypothetical protein [Phytoactinopolyspora mesophila]|uniref:Uncharacterized protein n=1 Tax=Phytoactinopolyspora mesophila TaxID=2650750 RepID=A0A7K3MAY3_9ACTN|nr:hypothetical protein [Phytoactinopolyspora mesophila]NDL60475.1 hypothetical protein [Phytoactinopolyspora mesophila]